MTDQVPSAATLSAVRKLINEYGAETALEARKVALRLWPRIDADQLDAILDAWKAAVRPVTPLRADVITLSSVTPIGAGRVRDETETE
jgi:hypothetical protein